MGVITCGKHLLTPRLVKNPKREKKSNQLCSLATFSRWKHLLRREKEDTYKSNATHPSLEFQTKKKTILDDSERRVPQQGHTNSTPPGETKMLRVPSLSFKKKKS